MKKSLLFIFILCACLKVSCQNTLLLEKIGTSTKYYYHLNDHIKLRTFSHDSLLKGYLWGLGDSTITVTTMRPYTFPVTDVAFVYKQFKFPRKLSIRLAEAAAVFAVIIGVNHLINNENVFNPDVLIVPAVCLGGSLISLSFSQKRCRIGNQWKLKVLDLPVRQY